MTVQEFVNIDKDLQTVQDISDVNIIILIYLFIKHVTCIIYTYVFVQVQNACQSSWKFIFSYDHITSSVIAKLVIPANYRLHRRWQFNEGAMYI
jgi:hypothetical protein